MTFPESHSLFQSQDKSQGPILWTFHPYHGYQSGTLSAETTEPWILGQGTGLGQSRPGCHCLTLGFRSFSFALLTAPSSVCLLPHMARWPPHFPAFASAFWAGKGKACASPVPFKMPS